jgi:F-type H+-transporting ATPase subunit b
MAEQAKSSSFELIRNLFIGSLLMVGGAMLNGKTMLPEADRARNLQEALAKGEAHGHNWNEHSGNGLFDGVGKVQNMLDGMGLPLNLGITIATVGVLLIVFPLIKLFFTNPLQAALEERNSNLENTFTEAESLRNEMTSMKSDYERKLATTEAEAREKINAQIKEAQSLRQSLLAEATEKSDALIKQAQAEIASEKAKALTDIRVHVTGLALGAAEKVVAKNMDSDLNRKLVDDFIKDLEVSR